MSKRTLLCLLLLLCTASAHAAEWGPWSVSATAPVVTPAVQPSAPLRTSGRDGELARLPFTLLLKLYTNYISPLDGDRCPMYPTCSRFSSEAIRKHGLLVGIVMTSDRLLHEADERHYHPAVKVGAKYRIIDPVANNDFWWYQP